MTEEKPQLGTPEYDVIPDAIAAQMIRPARSEVTWIPVIEELLDGRKLFVADTVLSEGSLKYLRLALSTRQAGKGGIRFKLHAQRGWLGERQGRLLWAVPQTNEVIVPEMEVVG